MLKFKNLSKKAKILSVCGFAVAFLFACILFIYIIVLPAIISNHKVISFVENYAQKTLNIDMEIKNPALKTAFSPRVKFQVGKIALKKDNKDIFVLINFDTDLSLKKLLNRKIVLNKMGVDFVYADADTLKSVFPQTNKKQNKTISDWKVEWLDSLLYVKHLIVNFSLDEQTKVKIRGGGISISDTKEPKYVRFKAAADITKGKQFVHFGITDNDTVYIKDKKLIVENGILGVNNSKVSINYVGDTENNFNASLTSKDFDIAHIVNILETNIIIPNGKNMMSFFKDTNGKFDFTLNLSNAGINGNITLKNNSFKLVPLANLPVTIEKGVLDLTSSKINLRDFKGYYGKNKKNNLAITGSINDYTKTVQTDIELKGQVTNEFVGNYLSKLVGYPLTLTGNSGMRLMVKTIYDKIDVIWQFKIPKGYDLLVDGASLSPVNTDRVLTADLHIEDNLLNIKAINYYIASVIDKNTKGLKPILTIAGNLDLAKNAQIKNIGFETPKPLPSEFLNVLIGQKIFKKGTIAGKLQMINTGKYPILDGKVNMEKVVIPSQRLFVKNANLSTDSNIIYLNADGRFKRSAYKFNGKVRNALLLPVIVRDVNLNIDNIDVEKILASMNEQNTAAIENQKTIVDADENDTTADESFVFNTGLIVVERCVLHVVKGFYKDINFGNLIANLTLDKNGFLEIKSNKFDFAEGISTLKIGCDLKNHLYNILLGVKDINSDLIAGTLLGLKKEITGKASGVIILNADDSLKLNGKMKFAIVNGTIGKVGLVEYVLKFAALFRNPLAMVSPTTVLDLVNIPEGNFDKIEGELLFKDNVAEKIMIKSSAPQLSSFIIGRFDLTTRDAALRIYTKFSNSQKGLASVLRNISLNSLANKMSFSGRNDSNYYATELSQIPPIDAAEKDCQVFLTKVDGEVETGNFISSLKKIK